MDHFERYMDSLPAAAAVSSASERDKEHYVIVVPEKRKRDEKLAVYKNMTFNTPEQARIAMRGAGLYEVTLEELREYGVDAANKRVLYYKKIYNETPCTVIVEQSGHRFIEAGKTYGPAEFSHLLEKAEDEWINGKENDEKDHLGYARIIYKITNVPFDGKNVGEIKCRQAIGDGDGSLVNHVRNVLDDNIEMLKEWGLDERDREALKEARLRRCWILSFIECAVKVGDMELDALAEHGEELDDDIELKEAEMRKRAFDERHQNASLFEMGSIKYLRVAAASARIISLLLEREKIKYCTSIKGSLGVVAVSAEDHPKVMSLIKAHNVDLDKNVVSEENKSIHDTASAEQYLRDRIKDILENDGMENFCKLPSLYSLRNYSFANAVLIKSRMPEASVCRSDRVWQTFGRCSRPDQVPLKIFQPVVLGENNITSFWTRLKKEIAASYSSEKNYGEAKIPDTDVSITGNNDSYDIRIKGKILVANQPSNVIKKWMTKVMLNKVTIDHTMGNVYDISQTDTSKEFLWVKSDMDWRDMVCENNGKPVTDAEGFYKIRNTDQRKNSFVPDKSCVLKRRDTKKLETLYDVLRSVATKMGHPILEISAEEAELEKKEGFYSAKDQCIKISRDEDLYDKVSMAVHELAVAETHTSYFQKNANAYEMDIQSEAAACIVAGRFGVSTDIGSFRSCPQMAKIRPYETIRGYLENMWSISRQISTQIDNELLERGLEADLENIDKVKARMMSADEIKEKISGYTGMMANIRSANIAEKKRSEKQYHDCVINNIRQIMEELIKKQSDIEAECNRLMISFDRLEACSTPKEQRYAENAVRAGFGRIAILQDDCVKLRNAIEIMPQPVTPQQEFMAAPMNFMSKMPEFDGVSHELRSIIAQSQFIKQEYSPMLDESVQSFADAAIKQAENIKKVMSKNGTAVEIVKSEYFDTRTELPSGMVMHPRYADDAFKKLECEVKSAKRAAERNGSYFPSPVTILTVYSNIDTFIVKGVAAMSTTIFVGDGMQNSLSDHISMISKGIERTEVCENFFESLKEKGKMIQCIYPDENSDISMKSEEAHDRVQTVQEWSGRVGGIQRKDNIAAENTNDGKNIDGVHMPREMTGS